MRCAVLDDYQDVARSFADWSKVDLTVFTTRFESEDEAAEALQGFEIIVMMRERTPFTATLLARLPDLKLLVTTGPRNASIDKDATIAQGITVCGTASTKEPPAEITWALLLGLARHLKAESGNLHANGPWQVTVGTDLHGATLGLLGLGGIGSQVARVGLAFGMDVVAWSENLTDERCAEVGVRRAASLDELLPQADFVSLHLVLSKRTRGLLGAAEFALMKPGARLINTSRSGLADTDAMLAALDDRLAGAGLDVFDVEPLPADDPLRTHPRVLSTPHLGYVTENNYRVYFGEAVEDIEAFLSGAPVRTLW